MNTFGQSSGTRIELEPREAVEFAAALLRTSDWGNFPAKVTIDAQGEVWVGDMESPQTEPKHALPKTGGWASWDDGPVRDGFPVREEALPAKLKHALIILGKNPDNVIEWHGGKHHDAVYCVRWTIYENFTLVRVSDDEDTEKGTQCLTSN